MIRFTATLFAFLAGVFMQCAFAQATDFPTRPIRIIVPYAPGGATDVIARSLGEALSRRIGKSVVVENRAGAGGIIGVNVCRSASPDGYTYCMLLADSIVIQPNFYKKLPYDPLTDLAPVIPVVNVGAVVATTNRYHAKTLKDLADEIKKSGGPANFGSHGPGTSAHLALELISRSMSVPITHVPYQGGGHVIAAMLGKQVDMTTTAYGILAQHIAKGTFNPIAVVGRGRLALLPNTPTLKEQGMEFEAEVWQGLFAPKNTPKDAIEFMNTEVNKVLRDTAFIEGSLAPQGFLPLGGSPSEFALTIKRDAAAWGGLAKPLNLVLD